MSALLIRIVWFALIGWWLGPLWAFCALMACVSIIGLPLGVAMFPLTFRVMFLA